MFGLKPAHLLISIHYSKIETSYTIQMQILLGFQFRSAKTHDTSNQIEEYKKILYGNITQIHI